MVRRTKTSWFGGDRVMRIALAQHGSVLATRWLGGIVRDLVMTHIAEGPVELDFAGVDLASPSFLDEAFGKLTDTLAPSLLNERCHIVNANPTILAMLRMAIRERRRMREADSRHCTEAAMR